MLPDLSEKQEKELHNFSDYMEKLILSHLHSENPWEVHRAGSLHLPKKSLTCSETKQGPTYFQIPSLLQL